MPVNLPRAGDVRTARAQATKTISENLEQVRPPFLAWVGANDLAVSAVRGALARASARAQAVQGQLPRGLDDLRVRLNREELRTVADAYGNAARGTYQALVQRGEDVVDKIKSRPQVKRVLDGLDTVSDQVEGRVEEVVEDFRERGNEVLGRVARTSRSVGERVARTSERTATEAAVAVSDAADAVAETVTDAGDEAAHTARSAGRRAGNRTAPAKPAPRRATRSPHKQK